MRNVKIGDRVVAKSSGGVKTGMIMVVNYLGIEGVYIVGYDGSHETVHDHNILEVK